MSAAEFRSRPKEKRAKYGNKRVMVNGVRFDSQAEAKRWIELRELEKQGLISHLERQPKFKFVINGQKVVSRSERYPNGRQVSWKGDFAYFDGKNRIVEDVKGFRTKEFILKKAFVEAIWPAVRIVEVPK
jgi:hypothetical protein